MIEQASKWLTGSGVASFCAKTRGRRFYILKKKKDVIVTEDQQFLDTTDVTAYSYTMVGRGKRLEKAKRNPSGLRYGEFETLLGQCDWVKDHQSGSHRIWKAPSGFRLPTQPMPDGKAKGYQVRQFLSHLFEEADDEE